MAKAKRGRNIKTTKDWRGTCPVCKRDGVKLMWIKTEEGSDVQLKTCKVCGS